MANQDDLGANPKIFELGKITLEGYPDVYVHFTIPVDPIE